MNNNPKTAASRKPQPSAVERDPTRLQQFLELVQCRPSEVRDVPQGRALSTEELRAECARVDPEARRASLAQMKIHFGMHKGKRLADVPVSYLKWALRQKPTNKSFRKFQTKVQQFLEREVEPSNAAELRDPLTREYLSIVKHS